LSKLCSNTKGEDSEEGKTVMYLKAMFQQHCVTAFEFCTQPT